HLPAESMVTLPRLWSAVLADLRGEFFRDGLRTSEALSDDISVFLRDWLWRMSLAMLTATAARNAQSLQSAQARLQSSRSRAAEKVLNSIFQLRDVEVPH